MTLGVGSAVSRFHGTGGKLLPSSLPSVPTCLFIKLRSVWQCLEFPCPYVKFGYRLSVITVSQLGFGKPLIPVKF